MTTVQRCCSADNVGLCSVHIKDACSSVRSRTADGKPPPWTAPDGWASCSTNKDANTLRLIFWDRALNGMLKVPAVPVFSASVRSLRVVWERWGSRPRRRSQRHITCSLCRDTVVDGDGSSLSGFTVQAHFRLRRHGQGFMWNAHAPVHHVTLAADVISPPRWRGALGQCCHFEQFRPQSSWWHLSLAPHRHLL